MLKTLVDYNNRNNAPLSNEKLWQAVNKVVAKTEEEQLDAECNANIVTIDIFCYQSPVTTNTQGEIANMTKERSDYLDILAETIKWFIGLTIQSTINDYES